MSRTWLQRYLLRQASGASGRRWRNWKELVFYGHAETYTPQASPDPCRDPPDKCLTVNSQPSQRVVVIGSGKRLPNIAEIPDPLAPAQPPLLSPYDQARSDEDARKAISNYLEGDNATPGGPLRPPPHRHRFIDRWSPALQ